MVLLLFPSAGKQLEKVLSLYHARGYENAPIFDFKQSDGKLYQNRKQGGYGDYMGFEKASVFQEFYLENKKEVTTKLLPWSAEAQSLKI